MFDEIKEGKTNFCPFCEATRRVAEEQIAILKEECAQMKWERDLAWKALEEKKMKRKQKPPCGG